MVFVAVVAVVVVVVKRSRPVERKGASEQRSVVKRTEEDGRCVEVEIDVVVSLFLSLYLSWVLEENYLPPLLINGKRVNFSFLNLFHLVQETLLQ
jgi:hypothetical protein